MMSGISLNFKVHVNTTAFPSPFCIPTLYKKKEENKNEKIPQLNAEVKSNLYQVNEAEIQAKIDQIIAKNRP